jgi:hypothetical protein
MLVPPVYEIPFRRFGIQVYFLFDKKQHKVNSAKAAKRVLEFHLHLEDFV